MRKVSGACWKSAGLAMFAASATLAAPAAATAADGWLYIQRYLSEEQMGKTDGVAVAPFWFFDRNGALVPSDRPDGMQTPGRLVKVAPGEFHVVAGQNNVGPTRVAYTVVPGKVTVVKTGFVQVSTWRSSDQPKADCAPWDAELTAFVEAIKGEQTDPKAARWLPILSNPGVEVGTRDFGLLQLPVGAYRILWHGLPHDVEVREGEVYRLPLGTAGPLGEDRPKARLSVQRGDAADNPTLNICQDGPTHVVAGPYWLSYMQQLDVFPYEERVWTQTEVVPTNDHGHARRFKPEGVSKPVHKGEGSEPTPAAIASLAKPDPAAPSLTQQKQDKGDALLGGGGGIDWDSPP